MEVTKEWHTIVFGLKFAEVATVLVRKKDKEKCFDVALTELKLTWFQWTEGNESDMVSKDIEK
jgi:hypothetical protein